MLKNMGEKPTDWKSGEEVYNWWLNDNREKQIEGQQEMEI